MTVEKEVMDYRFTLKHYPQPYFKARALVGEAEKRSVADSFLVFKLFMSNLAGTQPLLRAGTVSGPEYFARLQYFDFDAKQDIYLVHGSDTIPCAYYHFERTYDMVPFNCINLGFPLQEPREKLRLFFDERVLGTGRIIFELDQKKIKKANSVKFTEQ